MKLRWPGQDEDDAAQRELARSAELMSEGWLERMPAEEQELWRENFAGYPERYPQSPEEWERFGAWQNEQIGDIPPAKLNMSTVPPRKHTN